MLVEVLARTLENVKGILAQQRIIMPGHLQLQLDNTTRDNNIHTVFNFLNYLTYMFDTCGVNFFEVGHTHLDQGQQLSVVGPVVASAEELETPTDFANIISNRHQPLKGHRLHVGVLESICRMPQYNHSPYLNGLAPMVSKPPTPLPNRT